MIGDMDPEYLFRRGYLVVENSRVEDVPRQVHEWDTDEFRGFSVLSHPELPVELQRSDDCSIALLGHVIDPINGRRAHADILSHLSESLSSGREHFFDALDDLTGRFVLLIDAPDGSFAVQDAAGVRSLFYDTHTSSCLLSSHPEIIAMMEDYKKSELADEVSHSHVAYFPGLSTPFSNIYRLTPNTLLTLPERTVKRFFPREPLPSGRDLDDVTSEIGAILTSQMELWNEDADLLLSLSAGLDSRLSLAATRSIADDLVYYSWIFPDRDYGEAEIARELCDHLGLEHRTINLLDEAPQEFVDGFMKNTSGMSIVDRAHGIHNFRKKFPKDRVELRSNVAEVGRTYYRNTAMFLPNRIDASVLTKLYFRANSDDVVREFQRFLDVTGFDDERIYNYDPYDLIYWEFRMGSWLSTWLLDKDLSHDTFVVYNNRTLLKKMLSVDASHRRHDELFYELIRDLWPGCLDIPINPHTKEEGSLAKNIERLGYGVAFRAPLPIFRQAVNWYRGLG